jgi:hypothetical protein
MTAPARRLPGLLVLLILLAGEIVLLRVGVYGWTIFVIFPMILGGLAAWIFRPTGPGKAAMLGALAVAVASCILILGVEGLICIGMVMPLAMPLGALGAWLVYRSEPSRLARGGGIAMLILLPPVGTIWDTHAEPAIFEVRSSVEINAPPERVWQLVVAFSELPEPREWFFRAGLAYPRRARIEGTGVGAIRYCEFSTGAFVEPIQVWDEPRLLQFQVTENPAPMHEWSPFGQIAPRHLHGYMTSRQGQFLLTRLSGGRTRLEGSTWYSHGLWPAEYWRWWSDAIIHRIHLRVLSHIKKLAEAGGQG